MNVQKLNISKMVSELVSPIYEEMLMRCVQTIKSQCTHHDGSTNQASKQNSSTNQGSKLVMLATHRDLQDQCPESREEKIKDSKASFVSKFNIRLAKYGTADFIYINSEYHVQK